jgi:peptidoglycan/xylan/chitin deacetylase (PgdA/CDA1 family)
MLPASRIPYEPIVDRPPLAAPPGVRLIVWPVVNVEVWRIERPMPRQVLPPPTHVNQLPDLPHWGWHEYGMRVGFWRIKELLDRLGIVPTLAINGAVCTEYRRVAEESLKAGWEFMGHGYDQRPTHQEPDERETIARTVEAIRRCTGKPPSGWLAPGLTETLATPDLLAEAGIRYTADWVIDDEPCTLHTRCGALVALPYTVELNDISIMMVGHHAAAEFEQRCLDYFDRVYAESAGRPKVMAIAVHPYISGVPHRIRYVEAVFERLARESGVAFWTGERILEWYLAQRAPAATDAARPEPARGTVRYAAAGAAR